MAYYLDLPFDVQHDLASVRRSIGLYDGFIISVRDAIDHGADLANLRAEAARGSDWGMGAVHRKTSNY